MSLRSRLNRMDPRTVQHLAAALVALVAIAVYANSLWNGFAYDDIYIIEKNTRVHNLGAWRDIWLKPYWPFHGVDLGIYRPFAIFMYAVQWALGGGEPWVFHTLNVTLHAIVTVLVYHLLARLTARTPALLGALVFAVHPIHTEAVANVVGQAELFAAIGLLGACLIHITRPEGIAVSWPRRLAMVPLFALALATKENSVVLPGLLIALDFAQRRVQLSKRGLLAYADALIMPLFLLGATLALYLIVRFEVMNGSLVGVNANPALPYLRESHRLFNALRAFPEFVRLLFFPLDLAADYAPGVILAVDSLTLMGVLGALLLAGLAVLAIGTPWWPVAGLPAAWFLISILIVSNLFFPIGVLIAERTLYLPSVAVSIIVAILWHYALPNATRRMRRLAPALLAIALVLMGVRTWLRNPSWDNTTEVFKTLARDFPESYRAQWAQATVLWNQGDLQGAALRYAFAERMYPRDSQFLVEYGSFLLDTGRRAEALTLFERSYRMHPEVPSAAFMLAYTYALEGRNHEALDFAARAEALGLARVVIMPLRAQIYHALGEHDKAVASWRVTVAYGHQTTILWAYLARTLAIAGYEADADVALDRGAAIAKNDADKQRFGQLRELIREGCYRDLDARPRAANGAFAMPACDPLGDFFKIAMKNAEIASTLQNASVPPVKRADETTAGAR